MPKKSKRVAARQAQLSGRGRRARRHGPSGFVPQSSPSAPPAPAAENDVETDLAQPASVEAQVSVPPQSRPAEPPPTPAAPTRSRRRAAAALSPVPYFKPEIVRIGVITAIIIAILTVLTVTL